MKNRTIFVAIIGFILVATFSQCYKAPVFKVKITCHYSSDIDTGEVVSGAIVTIGKDSYPNGESAEFAKATGETDANGVFEHEFLYEALLDVNAIKVENVDGTEVNYIGVGQVKLVPDEVVEKVILLRR